MNVQLTVCLAWPSVIVSTLIVVTADVCGYVPVAQTQAVALVGGSDSCVLYHWSRLCV